ncbi:MAG: SIS domain-containing protein [Phycisphaerae bacterium]|nr:SIS domain-containing protein [Phycisphaerae bacterium]
MHSDSGDRVDDVCRQFEDAGATLRQCQERLASRAARAAELILASLRDGRCVYTFGNGGSAADAQHFAAELVGRFLIERGPLRATALTTDTSILTAVANDYDYRCVFARQLAGLGRAGDVAIGLTTSGNSPNVLAALAEAKRIGMHTVAFTGDGGGQCAALADVLLDVPSTSSPRIQESHAVMYHIICSLIERALAE